MSGRFHSNTYYQPSHNFIQLLVGERGLEPRTNELAVRQNLSKLESIAKPLPQERAAVKKTDVSVHGEVMDLVAFTIDKFGQINVLVNDAGYMPKAM